MRHILKLDDGTIINMAYIIAVLPPYKDSEACIIIDGFSTRQMLNSSEYRVLLRSIHARIAKAAIV